MKFVKVIERLPILNPQMVNNSRIRYINEDNIISIFEGDEQTLITFVDGSVIGVYDSLDDIFKEEKKDEPTVKRPEPRSVPRKRLQKKGRKT